MKFDRPFNRASSLGIVFSSILAVSCTAPASGPYVGSNDKTYMVSTNGPTAMRLSDDSGLCILFWREKRGPDENGILTLHGSPCNDTSMIHKWTALQNSKSNDEFTIIPPEEMRFKITYQANN